MDITIPTTHGPATLHHIAGCRFRGSNDLGVVEFKATGAVAGGYLAGFNSYDPYSLPGVVCHTLTGGAVKVGFYPHGDRVLVAVWHCGVESRCCDMSRDDARELWRMCTARGYQPF